MILKIKTKNKCTEKASFQISITFGKVVSKLIEAEKILFLLSNQSHLNHSNYFCFKTKQRLKFKTFTLLL